MGWEGAGNLGGRAAQAAGCNQAQKVDRMRSKFFQSSTGFRGTYDANQQ